MAQNALPVKTANIRQQYASTCSKKLPGLEYFSRMQGHDVSLPAQAAVQACSRRSGNPGFFPHRREPRQYEVLLSGFLLAQE